MEKIDLALEKIAVLEAKIDALMAIAIQMMFMGHNVDTSPQVASGYKCPFCNQKAVFQVREGGVVRDCGCGTKLIPPPDLEKLQEQLIGKEQGHAGFGNAAEAVAEALAEEDVTGDEGRPDQGGGLRRRQR